MIGSSKTALEMGIAPAYICVGAAAGVKRFIDESEDNQQSVERAKQVLSEVSELDAEGKLAQNILAYYQMLLDGASLQQLLQKAELQKHESLLSVI